ncbi:MAG: hydrolase, partial [Thermoflexibacter sp.]|nr:hydrolase [Thermoflexibacter sp.]
MKFIFVKTLIFICFLLISTIVCAQKKNEHKQYHIHRASSEIKIDGIADDPAWEKAEIATDFYMVLPMDTSMANVRTEVRMLYDDKHFYLVVVNYDKLEGDYMVESLRRDFSFG